MDLCSSQETGAIDSSGSSSSNLVISTRLRTRSPTKADTSSAAAATNGVVIPNNSYSTRSNKIITEPCTVKAITTQTSREYRDASAVNDTTSRSFRTRTTLTQVKTNDSCNNIGDNSNKAAAPRDGQLTEYFPIRRSERKPKAKLMLERQMDIERKILQGSEEGLRVS